MKGDDDSVRLELFRKALHIIWMGLMLLPILFLHAWYYAVFAVAAFLALAYPTLTIIERVPLFWQCFNERKPGEVKRSMILAAAMMVLLITVFWGLLGSAWKSYIVISVMAWGFGDTAAALVGIAYGRHPIKHHLADGNKSLEGSLAMYFTSLLVIFATTLFFTSAPWYLCLTLALLAALVSAGVELISRNGIDTVTIPCSVAISLYVLSKLLSFLS